MQPQRRSYSRSFKAQVIQACAQSGASIASIALHHSLNANLVHWTKQCNHPDVITAMTSVAARRWPALAKSAA
ncbi:transposase [Pseudomonas sp. 7P_10.2_Bac1]|uniref:transposase n=1 Tax=Pseudomonas sp. 7P_10.2_Bac1 TaxID=2971614 RepID=UPI003965AFFB